MRQIHLRHRGSFLPPLDEVTQYGFEPGYVVFTLPCPKRIRVMANGITLADSARALSLFESDHIPICYTPLADIRMELFGPGGRLTDPPYKGEAQYCHVQVGGILVADALWYCADPVQEAARIRGLLCFGTESLDQVAVDGEIVEPPVTSFEYG